MTSSAETHIDLSDFAQVRRRIVDPVVAAVLTPQEVASIAVVGEAETARSRFSRTRSDGVLCHVIAWDGDECTSFLGCREIADARDVAGKLASDLEDWICETSWGWGEERRTARYEIPG